jgi:hypothetical protein
MESMLTLCGQVVRVFETPGGVDKKTGEAYEGGERVQLLAEIPLRNGQAKFDLVTLSTDQGEAFRELTGATVRVPVGAYSMRGGVVGFFALKGVKPLLVAPGPAEAA